MKIAEYKIVTYGVAEMLSDRVNELIAEGWQPVGPAGVANTGLYYQTIVKYEEEANPVPAPPIKARIAVGQGDNGIKVLAAPDCEVECIVYNVDSPNPEDSDAFDFKVLEDLEHWKVIAEEYI